MNKDEMTTIIDKFTEFCAANGITNAAMCGSTKNTTFIGGGIPATLSEMILTACNVGRLWQHFRTLVRDGLHQFEKELPHD